MRPQRPRGMEGDLTRNGASMTAFDKTLATTSLLRDNGLVGTPDRVADRWQACQETHSWEGLVAA